MSNCARWLWVCALGLGSLGCGGDDGGGGGLGDLFEALNGNYQLRAGTDCVIRINGSQIEARTTRGDMTCAEEDEDGDSETLLASGTLTDSRIEGTLVYEDTYSRGLGSDEDGCEEREGTRYEIMGTAEKMMGRQSEGRFGGLAGVWRGQVSKVESYLTIPCDGPVEVFENTRDAYTFEADVYGDFISAEVDTDDGSDTVLITDTDTGDLLVDGEVISFEP